MIKALSLIKGSLRGDDDLLAAYNCILLPYASFSQHPELWLVTLSGCSLLLRIDTVAWYGLIGETDLDIFKLGAV